MKGVVSYEERLKNLGISLLDFEFITMHPEVKPAIWNKFCTDALFHKRILELEKADIIFRKRFENAFYYYRSEKRGR